MQGASLGDVNGDGRLEVVVGTEGGALHVLEGSSGRPLPNFPFQAQGHISAETLITRLSPGPSMQLVFMAHDGLLYMVDGISGIPQPYSCTIGVYERCDYECCPSATWKYKAAPNPAEGGKKLEHCARLMREGYKSSKSAQRAVHQGGIVPKHGADQ